MMAVICVLIGAVVFAVFGGVAGGEFVNYDDPVYVINNPNVSAGLTLRGFGWAFTHPHARNWHPLTTLSHMSDVQLFGMNASAHHLMNVALHAAAAIVLFLALRLITGTLWLSAFVCFVFAVHPLRVESVAWVSERKDVLSAFFFALTLLLYAIYVRRGGSARYTLVILSFLLGLLSKSMLVTTPVILLLLDWWPLGRQRTATVAKLLLEKLPLFVMAASAGVITYLVQKGSNGGATAPPLEWRAANALNSYVVYLKQLVWPANLSPVYPVDGFGISAVQFIGVVGLLAAISVIVWMMRHKRPYLLLGWGWYLVMLLPVIGFIQIGLQRHADRYTYLPEIGIVVSIAWLVAEVSRSWRNRRVLLLGGSLFCIIALGLGARAQALYWHDSETLWSRALALAPTSEVANNNLGMVLLKQGRVDDAMVHFQRVLRLHDGEHEPFYALSAAFAHSNLAVAYSEKGETQLALQEAEQTVTLQPEYPDGHFNLATVRMQLGRTRDATVQYRRAVELRPDDAEFRTSLGNSLLREGHEQEAVMQYRVALELAPESMSTLNNLAWILSTSPDKQVRDGHAAVTHAKHAVRLSEERDASFLRTLAAAYAETGEFATAISTGNRAARLAAGDRDGSLANEIGKEVNLYKAELPLRDSR